MPKQKRLLFSTTIADCQVDTFTVSGSGGAGKDTSNTGVRVTHKLSGAVGKCVEHRSAQKNREIAFRRMGESREFQTWARRKAAELASGKSIDELVEEQLTPDKLKVEVRSGAAWTIIE